MLDLTTYRVLYPEMDQVADALVEAKLAEAEDRISADYFGATEDVAHGLLTSHLIAISPAGKQARLIADKSEGNSTTYYREYVNLLQENYPGPLVL